MERGCAFCEFQFHKGTIKTLSSAEIEIINSYFNSIKVQLKLKVRT